MTTVPFDPALGQDRGARGTSWASVVMLKNVRVETSSIDLDPVVLRSGRCSVDFRAEVV